MADRDDLAERIARLSPAKRALLERRLQARRPASERDVIPRRPDPEAPAPLSFAQQRLWFLARLEPGVALYNLPLALRLAGPIRVAALERALSEIAKRHEVLRTTFRELDGGPVQVVLPHERPELRVQDLTALPAAGREDEAVRLAGEEAQRPFDLERERPLRAELLRLSATDHLLLLTMHHIASDGWSMGILQRELTLLYTAISEGRDAQLGALPIQYADFSVWQRERLQGPELDRLLGFWVPKLAGMPALLELPLDRPRPPVQVFDGASYAVGLPGEVLDGLKRVCRDAGVTLFVGLLAAFEILLARYSGQGDVVVGTPVANRTRLEVEGLIGFFVNTLVLRVDVSDDPSFVDLLARTHEATVEALEHQELPFEKLVEELQPERDLSHNPLFQVMFALQSQTVAAGPASRRPQFALGTSKFDLTLSATETTDGLQTIFEYNSALFEAPTVVAMADRYHALVEAAVASPRDRASALLGRGAVAPPRAATAADDAPSLVELCARQARRRPDAVALAVVGGGGELTYAELESRAGRLAARLAAEGVGAGSLVGLFAGRSPEFVVGVLGVLKAGAAFVPLDPAHPGPRLAQMLADSGAEAVVAEWRLEGDLPDFAGPVLSLDVERPAEGDGDGGRVEPPARDALAYVIYTSGSTGRPKGVMVAHRGMANLARAQQQVFGLREGDRILQFSALGFDACVFEILLALGAGATLCLANADALLPGPALVDTLRRERIGVLTISPSALSAMPEAPLGDLHTLIAASEACPPALVARWGDGRRFFNAYGPTETTVWATVAECRDPAVLPPIGAPIPNVRAYVLDERLDPVPDGVPGELCIGGAGVARGYHGQPGLTAERFLPDRFAGDGARMYRTGDRVRRRPDGQLQFLGRLDDQLKLRGYRVEPGEIQAALLSHPAVREAAVLAEPAPSGGERLVAFYVAGGDVEPSPRAFLRARLPSFMVPARWERVDALPLTPNGKLDRRALLTAARREPPAASGLPLSATEAAVAAIWSELLGVEAPGPDADFFDLGGHSLLATQVVSRLNERFGIDLPLRSAFEAPALASLAEAVDAARAGPGAEDEPAILGRARRLTTVAADPEPPAGPPATAP